MAKNGGTRMGGRNSRKAKRAAELPDNMKPVRPGLEGGLYKPLNESDLPRIHEAVLQVLETIGLGQPIPSCIEACIAVGCTVAENGRLLFPRQVVEDSLKKAGRNITLYGAIPKHDIQLSGKRVYFGTAGAAVHIVDPISREYRESTVADLYDIARLCDTLEHIHFFQRSMVCRDLEDIREMDLNTCYASISGTQKHVGTSFSFPETVNEAIQMLHLISGSETAWRERPFVSMSCCFVVPPLAGFVYVNAIQEGAPAIFGTWPFVSDLRTGAMSGGSGEQAVLMAACGQMAQFYDLPSGIAAGMTDSKIPDAQSGYEKGYTVSLAAHSGANMVYESAGMQASLLGCCPESYVIDNDMLGAINRTVRGIEVNDETLAIDPIREVCLEGPGHYLGHEQTLSRMQTDYLYPSVGDRENINNWIEQGSTDVVQRARKIVQDTLESHFPKNWDEKIDEKIREQFPVRLPRKKMKQKIS